jgi:hypothetical protein
MTAALCLGDLFFFQYRGKRPALSFSPSLVVTTSFKPKTSPTASSKGRA